MKFWTEEQQVLSDHNIKSRSHRKAKHTMGNFRNGLMLVILFGRQSRKKNLEACSQIGIFFLIARLKTSMGKRRKSGRKREYINDPNAVKPGGYDPIPGEIPDPKTKEKGLTT